jgi:hypothetical protein
MQKEENSIFFYSGSHYIIHDMLHLDFKVELSHLRVFLFITEQRRITLAVE